MRPNGVYVASASSAGITTSVVLIELQVPAATMIEIWRAWISLDGVVADAMQEVTWYVNDGPGTAGGAMTEQPDQGEGDAAASAVAVSLPTQAATPVTLWDDSFHIQQGYLHLPLPEERTRVMGGATNDNIGLQLRANPDASVNLSYGIKWAEFS